MSDSAQPRVPTERFQPRLGGPAKPAPFDPGAYYLVAFFGGILGLVYVAWSNLDRLASVRNTQAKTLAITVLAVVAGLAFLLLAPTQWWEPTRNIRFGLRAVAVAASGALYLVHRGPAYGAYTRAGEYDLIRRSWLPILGVAIAQGVITYIVGAARGVL